MANYTEIEWLNYKSGPVRTFNFGKKGKEKFNAVAVQDERVLALKQKGIKQMLDIDGLSTYKYMEANPVYMPDPADPVQRPDAYKIINAPSNQYINWCLRAEANKKKEDAKMQKTTRSGQEGPGVIVQNAEFFHGLAREIKEKHITERVEWNAQRQEHITERTEWTTQRQRLRTEWIQQLRA